MITCGIFFFSYLITLINIFCTNSLKIIQFNSIYFDIEQLYHNLLNLQFPHSPLEAHKALVMKLASSHKPSAHNLAFFLYSLTDSDPVLLGSHGVLHQLLCRHCDSSNSPETVDWFLQLPQWVSNACVSVCMCSIPKITVKIQIGFLVRS